MTCVACFYTLVDKFPTDMCAFQVLCANLFFDQSQVLWSVASCDANDKIESLLQKVELRSTLRNMLPQLATSKFVAWHVESEGGNTGNNAFQLATQQCCATSCAKMLLVLLDLYLVRNKLRLLFFHFFVFCLLLSFFQA